MILLLFLKSLEINLICAHYCIPQIHATCIISDIFAMMKIMLRSTRYEGENSRWAPWKLKPTVSLTTDVDLPDLPEKKHKAMRAIA